MSEVKPNESEAFAITLKDLTVQQRYFFLAKDARASDEQLSHDFHIFREKVQTFWRHWQQQGPEREFEFGFKDEQDVLTLLREGRRRRSWIAELQHLSSAAEVCDPKGPLPWTEDQKIEFDVNATQVSDTYLLEFSLYDAGSKGEIRARARDLYTQTVQVERLLTHSANDTLIGYGTVLWLEYYGVQTPSESLLHEIVDPVIKPWLGAFEDPELLDYVPAPFGFILNIENAGGPLYLLLVKATQADVDRASRILNSPMLAIMLSETKILRHREGLDIATPGRAKMKRELRHLLDEATAAMSRSKRQGGLVHIEGELDAIEQISHQIPKLGEFRSELAHVAQSILDNLNTVEYQLKKLDRSESRLELVDPVTERLRLIYQQAQGDLEYLDQLFEQTKIELEAMRTANEIHSLRWERTIAFIASLFVVTNIFTVLPELGTASTSWKWIDSLVGPIRIAILLIFIPGLLYVLGLSLGYLVRRPLSKVKRRKHID